MPEVALQISEELFERLNATAAAEPSETLEELILGILQEYLDDRGLPRDA
jgi:hypothetical protein